MRETERLGVYWIEITPCSSWYVKKDVSATGVDYRQKIRKLTVGILQALISRGEGGSLVHCQTQVETASSLAERKTSCRCVATARVVLSDEKLTTWNLASDGVAKPGTLTIVYHC